MAGSGTRIDYNLRPAKALERHILVDVIALAMRSGPGIPYGYVGMGSFAFADFILYHRTFGFAEMHSAESVSEHKERCEFNKPFSSIKLNIMKIDAMLDRLAFDRPYVIWLDFDDTLCGEMFDALAIVAQRAQSGTLLCVTLNAHYAKAAERAEFEQEQKDRIGAERFEDIGKEPDVLVGPSAAEALDNLLYNDVSRKALNNFENGDPIQVIRPLLFEYSDGAKMITSIYYLGSDVQCRTFKTLMEMSQLSAFASSKPYRIKTPILTPRERRFFEKNLDDLEGAVEQVGLKFEQLKDFGSIYRYWPYFAEVDI